VLLVLLSVTNLKVRLKKLSYSSPFKITFLGLFLAIFPFIIFTQSYLSINTLAEILPTILSYLILFTGYSIYPLIVSTITIFILKKKEKTNFDKELLDDTIL
jgi:hypothetical protein